MASQFKAGRSFKVLINGSESKMVNAMVYLRKGARRVDFIEEFSHWRMEYGDAFLRTQKQAVRAELKSKGLPYAGSAAEDIVIKEYMIQNADALGLEAPDVEYLRAQTNYLRNNGGPFY